MLLTKEGRAVILTSAVLGGTGNVMAQCAAADSALQGD